MRQTPVQPSTAATSSNRTVLLLLLLLTNAGHHGAIMSYYFAIVGTQDNPLFEHEFGTSKQGGDGQSRFTDQVRHLNQFIVHSSLDIAEEVQWSHGQMCVVPQAPPCHSPSSGNMYTAVGRG